MRVRSFRFHEETTGWTLEPMALDDFNLLVGISAAGKSRIVRALDSIQATALATIPAAPSGSGRSW